MKNRIISISLAAVLALSVGIISCGSEVLPEYSLTISSTHGGSVTSPGESGPYTYDEGEVVSLVAEAGEGYEFVNWTGDVDEIADVEDDTTTITMKDDYSITATFAVKQYNLVIHSTEGGSVTVPGEDAYTYDEGEVVNLVAQAEEGYYFVDWTGDTGGIANLNSASTSITINGNYSITANFEQDEVVYFSDPNLEAAIRQAIAKPEGPIYASELATPTFLDAGEQNIADLAGVEYCTNLMELKLWKNRLSDISPLADLTNLTTLDLRFNQVSDISALASLTHLTFLLVGYNPIIDISALASLTNLTYLEIWDTQIIDISPLADLTSLDHLGFGGSEISDISPLTDLANLTNLYLYNNQISDVSPLADLSNLTRLSLQKNQIMDISPLATLTDLTWLRLWDNQIGDILPLANLTNLTYLDLRANQVSNISPLVQNTGLGIGDNVHLEDNPLSSDSINIYIPQLEARGVTVQY